jgi:DNA-directed RNA polymerase II subunit RPB2
LHVPNFEIFNQQNAIEYIASFTKRKTIAGTLDILMNFFLPHIGTDNFMEKAYYIGYMVHKLLKVFTGDSKPTDRDNFKFKRIELTGTLIYELFREYYIIQKKSIEQAIDKEYYYHSGKYAPNLPRLIDDNYATFFKERILENGFKKAFKGNWGATNYTKKVGVSQKLNRLSFNSAISHLRKCVLQMDDSAKVVAPHLLHPTQWGIFDPVDSPDGGDIGLHKHLSICTRITDGYSKNVMVDILKKLEVPIIMLEETPVYDISQLVKLVLNGQWYGCIDTPHEWMEILIRHRRHGKIPSTTSISWNQLENSVYIYTDAGRLQRPLFYVQPNGDLSYNRERDGHLSWQELITGTETTPCKIEYVDADELNTYLVTFDNTLKSYATTNFTHAELHGSTLLGFMGNQIIFPEHSPLPRNCFSCSQSKQAVSMYHTNYQNRMDTMGVVLNYGQMPLTQSSYLESFGTLPYGINAIVAIMCYTGYNTEDAILINRGALDRGIFNTSYFKTYEMNETYNDDPEKKLTFEKGSNTDEHGLVKENTLVDEDTILMQMTQSGKIKNIYPNKDQVGRVDKTFLSEDVPGKRVAKVRICTERNFSQSVLKNQTRLERAIY